METLIVQTGMKHGRVAEVTRSNGGCLSVGRSYTNDLVLTDHHVAPRQLEFLRSGDEWRVKVLDTTNPVMLNNRRVTDGEAVIQSGDQIAIGRTRLRLYDQDHQVEPTRTIRLANWLTRDNTGFLWPLVIFLGVCGIDLVLSYLESSTDLKWEGPAYAVFFSAVFSLVWAGLWAVVGRVARHQHHFGLQLIVTSLVSLFATLLTLMSRYLIFYLHSANAAELSGWVEFGVVMAILLNLNLLIATNVQRVVVPAVLLALLVSGTFYTFSNSWEEEYLDFSPPQTSSLLPPPFSVVDGVPLEDYFADVADRVNSAVEDE